MIAAAIVKLHQLNDILILHARLGEIEDAVAAAAHGYRRPRHIFQSHGDAPERTSGIDFAGIDGKYRRFGGIVVDTHFQPDECARVERGRQCHFSLIVDAIGYRRDSIDAAVQGGGVHHPADREADGGSVAPPGGYVGGSTPERSPQQNAASEINVHGRFLKRGGGSVGEAHHGVGGGARPESPALRLGHQHQHRHSGVIAAFEEEIHRTFYAFYLHLSRGR